MSQMPESEQHDKEMLLLPQTKAMVEWRKTDDVTSLHRVVRSSLNDFAMSPGGN